MPTAARTKTRVENGLVATEDRVIAMISADRIRSVRMALRARRSSSPAPSSGAGRLSVSSQHLFRTLVAEIGAAQDAGAA
jgi:hypothetical protein